MEIKIEDITEESDLSVRRTKDLMNDGKKLDSCKQYGFKTAQASSLKIHMLVHSGEKSFSCTQCEFSCTSTGNLKEHMQRMHSKKNPDNCTQCKYSCARATL